MTELIIEKSSKYSESSMTIVGYTKLYGRPQYILVNSDSGDNEVLKFPGSRFRAPINEDETLEDMAKQRFHEQTGLTLDKMLGLRAIMPTRSRHRNQWIFRNIFLGVVTDPSDFVNPDGKRKVYLADPGQGTTKKDEQVFEFGDSQKKRKLEWITPDNYKIAEIATACLNNFDWKNFETSWYGRLPCVTAAPQTENIKRDLGCGLGVASMMLLYQPNEYEPHQIILLQRKGDKYPGYGGGKIETPDSEKLRNIDPVSCCMQEGAEEYGIEITAAAFICCACTPINMPNGDDNSYYNSLINYAFVGEPRYPHKVDEALKNPKNFLESKMEKYVVESLDEHRDRVLRGELRMPDMIKIGKEFYRTGPKEKPSLMCFRDSGVR